MLLLLLYSGPLNNTVNTLLVLRIRVMEDRIISSIITVPTFIFCFMKNKNLSTEEIRNVRRRTRIFHTIILFLFENTFEANKPWQIEKKKHFQEQRRAISRTTR